MVQVMNSTLPIDPDMYQGDNYTEENYEEDTKDHLQVNGFYSNGTTNDGTNGHGHNVLDDGPIEEEEEECSHDNDNGSMIDNNGTMQNNGGDGQMIDDGSSDDHDFFNLDSTDGLSQQDTNGYDVEFIKPGPRSRKRKMDRPLKVKLTLPELPPPLVASPLKNGGQESEHQQSSADRKSSRPSRAHKLPERFTPEVEKRPKGKKLSDSDSIPGSTLVLGTDLIPSHHTNAMTRTIDDEVPSILARVLADGSPPASNYNRTNNGHIQVPPLPHQQQPPPLEMIEAESELEVDQYTDEELDREIKRLKVRNLRAEVRRNAFQAKFYESFDRKFGQLLSVLIKGDVDTKKELVGIKNLLAQSLDLQLDGGAGGILNGHGHGTSSGTTMNGHGS